MSEFFDILGHKLRARAAIRKLDLQQCRNLDELIQERLVELKEIEEQERKQEAIRAQNWQKIQELAAEAGIDLNGNELPQAKIRRITGRSKGSRTPDKYQIMDIHGMYKNWDGFGHTPPQFKQAFSLGITKDECLKEKQKQINEAFVDISGCEQIIPELTVVEGGKIHKEGRKK